jgi:hypothetical protein
MFDAAMKPSNFGTSLNSSFGNTKQGFNVIKQILFGVSIVSLKRFAAHAMYTHFATMMLWAQWQYAHVT